MSLAPALVVSSPWPSCHCSMPSCSSHSCHCVLALVLVVPVLVLALIVIALYPVPLSVFFCFNPLCRSSPPFRCFLLSILCDCSSSSPYNPTQFCVSPRLSNRIRFHYLFDVVSVCLLISEISLFFHIAGGRSMTYCMCCHRFYVQVNQQTRVGVTSWLPLLIFLGFLMDKHLWVAYYSFWPNVRA